MNDLDLKAFVITQNISCLVRFHNHVDVLFRKSVNEIKELPDKKESAYWEAVYKHQFPKDLRKAVFLMIFGHLEEMLHILSNKNASLRDMKRFGLDRYKPFVRHVLGQDLSRNQDWQFIQEMSRVRNILLHAAGRIAYARKPDELTALIKKHPECFGTSLDRVELTKVGLRETANSASGLLLVINNALKKNDSTLLAAR
ncbi:MAG: hypothetical protein AABY95_04605 [Pseudomonadota bacterium]